MKAMRLINPINSCKQPETFLACVCILFHEELLGFAAVSTSPSNSSYTVLN